MYIEGKKGFSKIFSFRENLLGVIRTLLIEGGTLWVSPKRSRGLNN